jgi:YVTN family beta-propeller protein
MKHCHVFVFVLTALVLFSACKKDNPVKIVEPPPPVDPGQSVWVVNEGNFLSGNAAISIYNTKTYDVNFDFYKYQNGSSIGDVAQSMTRYNNRYYVVVNNSGKIVVCDTLLKKQTDIVGLTSPRYFLPISSNKAYVSDLSANAIHIIDLSTHTKTGAITCQGWTEQMVFASGKVFVCNVRKNFVYVINPNTNAITDSISVGINAYSLVTDKDGKLWVLSSGDKTNSIAAKLTRINPSTNVSEKTFTFPANETPGNLCINAAKDKLYFINSGIQSQAVDAVSLSSVKVVYSSQNFYGLAVNPRTDIIFASDALDYIQRSKIFMFDTSGQPVGNFLAGINASSFCFE